MVATTGCPEVEENLKRKKMFYVPVSRLGCESGRTPVRRAGDPESNLDPGENFSLKFINVGARDC